LRLDWCCQSVWCFITSEQMDRHRITRDKSLHGDFVARRVDNPWLKPEHSAIPHDGISDIGHWENRVRLQPIHVHLTRVKIQDSSEST
jgi:hypothetical protein